MNNINKQIIATQMPGMRPQNARSGLIQNQIPLLPFQGTNNPKNAATLGNFVTTTNTTGPSFFLLPSSVSGQGMVATTGNVTNASCINPGQTKGIAQLINTNHIAQNKGKIMLLTTAPGQIKTGQISQTVNFTTAQQNKTTITAPNQQKIITGITPSGAGSTFQFFAVPGSTNYGQNKFPIHITPTTNSNSATPIAPKATQIVTVIDNQNGQLQIRQAGPTQNSKNDQTSKILSTISTTPVQQEQIEMDPEEVRKLLEANEELESSGSSTDTSVELVPGISSFGERKENEMSYFERKELDELNYLQEQQTTSDNSNIKKVSCSFGFTEFGVTSITTPGSFKGMKRFIKDENDDLHSLNSFKTSISSSLSVSSNSASLAPTSTKKLTVSSLSNNSDITPKWQKDITQEEITSIHAFASLSSSVLLKKLKDIHNTAFHLAIEEEKEMLKARFLNILDNHTEININGHSCNLACNDFAYSESKLYQSSDGGSR